MCVTPVFNHTCKHTTRRSALPCEKAKSSTTICENSPDLIFDEPFKCTPCYDGIELRITSDQGKPRAYTSTKFAAAVPQTQTAKDNEVRALTAVGSIEAPDSSKLSQRICYEFYDEEGRRLEPVCRNNPQLRTPTTEKASSELGDSTPSPQGLSDKDQLGLQLDGATDKHVDTPQEADSHTAQQVQQEFLGDPTSPTSSMIARIDASASEQHEANDVAAPSQASLERATTSVLPISIQAEPVVPTGSSFEPEDSQAAGSSAESSLSSNAKEAAQADGAENHYVSRPAHTQAASQAEQAHQEEELHTAAILLINFSRHGLAKTASPADPGNHEGVLIPSAAKVRHSASVLIRIAQQCLEAIGAASGDDSNEEDEPVAPTDAATGAGTDDEEVRTAAAILVSLSQQAHGEAAQALPTTTARVSEDAGSETEEDTEEDSEETQAYLQKGTMAQ